jgi:hypothetical protein
VSDAPILQLHKLQRLFSFLFLVSFSHSVLVYLSIYLSIYLFIYLLGDTAMELRVSTSLQASVTCPHDVTADDVIAW